MEKSEFIRHGERLRDLLRELKELETVNSFYVTLTKAKQLLSKWSPDVEISISCAWCENETDGVYDEDKEFKEDEQIVYIEGTLDNMPTFYHESCWLEMMSDEQET